MWGGIYGGKAEFDRRSPNERGQQERRASVSCLWQGLLTEGLDFKCISITRLGCAQETLNSHRKRPLGCPAINRSAYKNADLIIIIIIISKKKKN